MYVEIGTNDPSNTRDVDAVVSDIIRFAQYILRGGVRRVIIGEILQRTARAWLRSGRHRVPIVSMSQYNRAVREANRQLAIWCHGSARISFWWHIRLHGDVMICPDGVHLTSRALPRYWREVRGAVLCSIRH